MLGPPKHRRISALLPPSSDTGRTNAGAGPNADANELAPVPPLMTKYESCSRLRLGDFAGYGGTGGGDSVAMVGG
jgi:hypothetical protein